MTYRIPCTIHMPVLAYIDRRRRLTEARTEPPLDMVPWHMCSRMRSMHSVAHHGPSSNPNHPKHRANEQTHFPCTHCSCTHCSCTHCSLVQRSFRHAWHTPFHAWHTHIFCLCKRSNKELAIYYERAHATEEYVDRQERG